MSSSEKKVAGEGGRPKRRRRQPPPPVSDAMSSSEKEDVDRDAVSQPFDPTATPAAARQVADATRAAVPKFATQQGEVIRAELRTQEAGDAVKQKQKQPANQQMVGGQAATEHALVMQQRREQSVAQYGGTGRRFPDGGPPRQMTAQASASSDAAAAQAAGEQMQMQQNRNRVAHQGTGPAVAGDGRVRAQRSQQIAGAETSVDPVALEQDLRMRQQIAAGKKKVVPQQQQPSESQQLNAAAEAAMQRDMEMQVSRQADAQEWYYDAAMAQARQRAAAEHIAVDKDVAMILQAAADAGLTVDQYCDYMMQTMSQGVGGGQQQDHRGQAAVAQAGALTMEQHRLPYMTQMTTMQQDVGGGQQQHHRGMMQMTTVQQNVGGGQQQQQHHRGQAEQFAGPGMTRDKNMTMAQQILAKHQKLEQEMKRKIAHAQQMSAVAEAARQKVLVAMQLQQQAAAYANAMQGNGSGATIMPFQPTGTANTGAFRVQQQLQLQPQLQSQHQTVNAQLQEESSYQLPPLPPWLADVQPHQGQPFLLLPGGSADPEAFDFEYQLLMRPQRVTTQVQEEPSLRWSSPGLAPPQQQTFLPGGLSGSANSQAVLAQQQPQQQRVNAPGSQEEQYDLPPLPPSLADWPRQQQNDGGDGGLSDLYWKQFPKLPPGGRQ